MTGTRRITLPAIVLVVPLLLASCSEPRNDAARSAMSLQEAPGVARSSAEQRAETGAQIVTAATTSASQGPASFSKRKAMHHVRRLARDIGVRVRASDGERRALRYAARRFRSFGYETKIQRFTVDGGTSRNVVAWWPGAKRYPFIVGGHVDTVAGSPGANDNASGVGVVLETARIFAATEQARWVRFVAFGAEEYGTSGSHHDGSRVFVERLGEEGRARLAGMLSVDMIADGRPLLTGNSDIASDVVARAVYRSIRDAGIAVRFTTLCDCSDHGPFEHAGIPAAFTYSGSEPDYHSPSDTVVNMSPRDLLRTGRAVRAFVRTLDKERLDRFRSRR